MGRNFVRGVAAVAVIGACSFGGFALADETPAPPPQAPPAPPATGEPPSPAPPPTPAVPAPPTPAEPPKDSAPPAPPGAPAAPADAPKEAPKEPPKEAPKEAPKETPAPAPTAEEKAATTAAIPDQLPVCPPPAPPCWHGNVTVRYRLRATEDASDNDLYEYLTLRFRNEEDAGWSGSMFGRLSEDLDGHTDMHGYYPFDDVDSTYGWFTGRLYHLYAGLRSPGAVVEQFRIGRQYVDAGQLAFNVDGVSAQTREFGCRGVSFHAFVGIPSHIFADSVEGDFTCGAGVSARPWGGGEARFDWAYLEDKTEFYGHPTDNLFTAEVRQRVGQYVRLRGMYQQVDNDPRTLSGSFDAVSPSLDATFRGTFDSQLQTEKALAYDIDPYYEILGSLKPYWQAHLAASKSIGEHFTAEGGLSGRFLWDSGDEGTYNHEFGRAYATLSTWGWPCRSLSLSATGEYWWSDTDTGSFGLEAEWKPCERWRAVAGVDYSLWRTDIYSDSERYDSYEYYVKATYAPNRRWRFDLSVSLEDDSVDTFVTVQAAARFQF